MVNFLAEISRRSNKDILPTPSNGVSRKYNVYELFIGEPLESSYWLDWGGHYDEYQGTQIDLYYSRFLRQVSSLSEMDITPFTLFVDGDTVYFNIPFHPWLYPGHASGSSEVIPFLSSALNPDKPSTNIIRKVPASVRLEIPSFTVKLSDAVSGITLNQGFSINLHNNDGYFDNDDKWSIQNTPVAVRKSTKENPVYEDFKAIMIGLVENAATDFTAFSIDAADKLRAMNEPVCGIIKQEDFDFQLDPEAVDKPIPVVYGIKKITPVKLNRGNRFFTAGNATSVSGMYDRDGILLPHVFDPVTKIVSFDYSAVAGVFDKNGGAVPFTYNNGVLKTTPNSGKYPDIEYIADSQGRRIPHKYDRETGVITFSDVGYAVINGNPKNRIGEIIRDIVVNKADTAYIPSFWNIDEVERYISISPRINIAFTSGDVKKSVQDILKNDMAYFIQQGDGKYTLRKWGYRREYALHEIPAWQITQAPKKGYSGAQENYFSACNISYSEDGDKTLNYLFTDNEKEAEDRYRKRKTSNYETDLIELEDVRKLAALLGGRYTTMRQTVTVSIGLDTTGMELLDRVKMEMVINGREVSKARNFIIKEINRAQDILTLEAIDGE